MGFEALLDISNYVNSVNAAKKSAGSPASGATPPHRFSLGGRLCWILFQVIHRWAQVRFPAAQLFSVIEYGT